MACQSLRFLRHQSLSTIVAKGGGGRHSNSGLTVAVFGGSGLIGRNLLGKMGREGVQAIIPHRTKDKKMIHYKLMGDLGQFNLIEFYDIRNDRATEMIVQNADVVVNCIGRNYSTRNYSLEEVLSYWPEKLSKICSESGTQRLIHLSAYGADIHSDNDVLKWKAVGENQVRKNYPDTIIVRPVQVFGRFDHYIGAFHLLPHIWGNYFIGKEPLGELPILKIPVHVGDVGQALLNACKIPKIEGQTYELFGPEAYYLDDLYDFVMEATHNETASGGVYQRQIRRVPISLMKIHARYYELKQIFGEPPIYRHVVDMYHRTEVPRGLPGMQELGVSLESQGGIVENILDIVRFYRKFKYYEGTSAELHPPKPVTMEEYWGLNKPPPETLVRNPTFKLE